MEGHVVLADEVVNPRVVRLPEVAPGVVVAVGPGPFDGRREVADHGLEPDVDALVVPAVERDGHAPVDIAGDGAVLEALAQHAFGEVEHVGAPEVLAVVEPFLERLLEGGEAEEVMLGGAQFGGRAGVAARRG